MHGQRLLCGEVAPHAFSRTFPRPARPLLSSSRPFIARNARYVPRRLHIARRVAIDASAQRQASPRVKTQEHDASPLLRASPALPSPSLTSIFRPRLRVRSLHLDASPQAVEQAVDEEQALIEERALDEEKAKPPPDDQPFLPYSSYGAADNLSPGTDLEKPVDPQDLPDGPSIRKVDVLGSHSNTVRMVAIDKAQQRHGALEAARRHGTPIHSHVNKGRPAAIRDTESPFPKDVESRAMLSTDMAGNYRRLQREAQRGHLERVEELVQILVTEYSQEPNVQLYSNLILANVSHAGSALRVELLLEEMEQSGINANSLVYENALKALAVHPDALLRGKILRNMREKWFDPSPQALSFVIAGYLREGQLEIALEMIDDMQQAGTPVETWIYRTLLSVLIESGQLDEALLLLEQHFETLSPHVNFSAWFVLFDRACEYLHVPLIRFIWTHRVSAERLNPSIGHCEQILHATAISGDADLAREIFQLLSRRKVNFELYHYQLLMEAYAVNGDVETSIKILQLMDKAGMRLNSASWWPLKVHALKLPYDARQASNILWAIATKWRPPLALFNTLINVCVDAMNMDEAMVIYSQTFRSADGGFTSIWPDLETFNALLRGCAQERLVEQAKIVASHMLAANVKPDGTTYDHLISLCTSVEDYVNAFRYFTEARETGMQLEPGSIEQCIAGLVSTKDERVWELLETMNLVGLHVPDEFHSGVEELWDEMDEWDYWRDKA